MKRLIAVAGLAVLAVASSAPASAGSWNAIERIANAAPVSVMVNGKPRAYFRVVTRAPLTVPVEGPARLRVVTRAELAERASGVVTYSLSATAGGAALETLDTETSAAEGVKLANGSGAVGKSRRMTFDVPAGVHKVTFSVTGAMPVLLRIQQSAAKGEEPMVSLTPLHATRSVTVNEGEKLITYYTTTVGQAVAVRVVGPTTLELLTRLDFDATMRGGQSYRLRVTEKGKLVKVFALETTKAVAASFTNLTDRVPSKFDRVRIPVPAGAHEFAIELTDPARGAAEIHPRIPAPSIGNEE